MRKKNDHINDGNERFSEYGAHHDGHDCDCMESQVSQYTAFLDYTVVDAALLELMLLFPNQFRGPKVDKFEVNIISQCSFQVLVHLVSLIQPSEMVLSVSKLLVLWSQIDATFFSQSIVHRIIVSHRSVKPLNLLDYGALVVLLISGAEASFVFFVLELTC